MQVIIEKLVQVQFKIQINYEGLVNQNLVVSLIDDHNDYAISF